MFDVKAKNSQGFSVNSFSYKAGVFIVENDQSKSK